MVDGKSVLDVSMASVLEAIQKAQDALFQEFRRRSDERLSAQDKWVDDLRERYLGLLPRTEFELGHSDLRVVLTQQLAATNASLRELLAAADLRYQQRFDAQQEALVAALNAAKESVASALSAADRAVAKAEMASEKRFESVNEFRLQLSDQAAKFVSRDVLDGQALAVDARFEGIARELVVLRERLVGIEQQKVGRNEQRTQANWTVGVALSGAGLMLSLIGVIIGRLIK